MSRIYNCKLKPVNLIPLIIFLCCCFLHSGAQEYAYKHYDTKDGLAGNHVYHAVQDKEGFIWFATEAGASRFDGTAFKNFTTAEGLPENEVLKLFVDSKGRVWMMPFSNKICYYYKGKLYNQYNDSILKKIELENYCQGINEDRWGNIFFLGESNIIVLTNSGKILERNSYTGNHIRVFGGGTDNRSDFIIYMDSIFFQPKVTDKSIELEKRDFGVRFWGVRLSSQYITPYIIIGINNYQNKFMTQSMIINAYEYNKNDTVNIFYKYNSISSFSENDFFFNTREGVVQYNFKQKQAVANYLQKENVSFTLRDRHSNMWFTTLDNGIFRLYSRESKNIYFKDTIGRKLPVDCISATSTYIIAGSDDNKLFLVNKQSGSIKTVNLKTVMGSTNNIIEIKKEKDHFLFLTSAAVQRGDSLFTKIEPMYATELAYSYKDFDMGDNGKCFFASHMLAFSISQLEKINAKPTTATEVLYNRYHDARLTPFLEERSTAICYTDSGVYIGTLKGLKFINWDMHITNLGNDFPVLKKRITRLLTNGNHLWVGTNDEGIVCYDGKKIVKNISIKDGLPGNLIRVLYADNNYLWAGTDRGLARINLTDTSYKVLQSYTTNDGLSSDIINAVYTEGDIVYVGTTEGLSYFNDKEMRSNSSCDLRILNITISGKERFFDSSRILLKNKDNNIRFDFVAISFKSEGKILYYYKLSGIDNEWKTTSENFLQYPTLPSGDYQLELYAVNKFGTKSEIITIDFEIEKKLVEETWFIVLLLSAAAGIILLLVNWRIMVIKRSQNEKAINAEKISKLEQQALKAQMNPHFIFNCLNSIQQYVIDKDVQGANKFISGFSRLIRQTLDNSGKQSITVAEEESFLRSYLELEKSRFENKFDYNITIDGGINKETNSLPPMLLQPYIENCIRHGIMHKSNGKGMIDISFNMAEGNLVCSIVDNGIGRVAAGSFKMTEHLNYESKGTYLTGQRIMMINKNNPSDIILETKDLFDDIGQPCGTKVTIVIPLQNTD